jgi:hypothetical protein
MADTVTSQTILDGERNCVMKFTNVSDGTGESAVAKVVMVTWTSANLAVYLITQAQGRMATFYLQQKVTVQEILIP